MFLFLTCGRAPPIAVCVRKCPVMMEKGDGPSRGPSDRLLLLDGGVAVHPAVLRARSRDDFHGQVRHRRRLAVGGDDFAAEGVPSLWKVLRVTESRARAQLPKVGYATGIHMRRN